VKKVVKALEEVA
jgi:hypothetical protein